MSTLRTHGILGIAAVLVALPAIGSAASLVLRRDTVVPVVFSDSLDMRQNRPGDRFTARVDDSDDAPRGTRLKGRIISMRGGRQDAGASMDLEFTDIILPDGTRHSLRAVPIPLNDANVRRERDGRLVVRRDTKKTEKYAIGGAIGGFIIGALGKKPLEGALIGAVAGAVAGEVNRKEDDNMIVRRGQKFGALIERDVRISFDDRDQDRWDDRRDDDRDCDDNRPNANRPRNDRPSDDRPSDDRYDEDRIVVECGREELRFSDKTQPYRLGETVMVPLERTASQLGLEVESGKYKALYVSGEEGSLRLERDSREARLNGKTRTLSRAVVEKDGVVYVPLEAIASLSRETITANGNRIDR